VGTAHTKGFATRLAIGILLFACPNSVAQELRVEIQSSWDGLGLPARDEIVVLGKGSKYLARGKNLKPSAVAAFLAALGEPPVMEPSIVNCGIDQAWLNSNYEVALQSYTHRELNEFSSEQIELFRGRFTRLDQAQDAFAQMFETSSLDDNPSMTIRVTVDGKEIGVRSDSQYPFLLPWAGLDEVRGGYNCHLSRSIADLLPKKFLNRQRLTLDESFRWAFTGQVMRAIEDQWNMLDAQHLVGRQVAPILGTYTPVKAAVTCIASIDVDFCGWHARLKGPTLPANMIIGVSLPYRNNHQIRGVQTFLSEAPQYVSLVRSVPWLSAFMNSHPETVFELRYVDDRSLSAQALLSVEEDLRQHGKSELATMVQDRARSVAFMEIACGSCCSSRVLVMPNRDVLVWHFQGESVLGFSKSQLDTWDFHTWRSAGALVKPNGTLVH